MPKGVYMRTDGDIGERIMKRVVCSAATGCWNWHGGKSKFGYGVIGARDQQTGKYKKFKVHRLSIEIFGGLNPAGRIVMHTCDNPGCVNPDHLRLGSYATNNLDMAEKGRHGMSKCDTPLVRVLRLAYDNGINLSALATCSGLAKSTVQKIVAYSNYKHVENVDAK